MEPCGTPQMISLLLERQPFTWHCSAADLRGRIETIEVQVEKAVES
jgi:hypothetical protein